MLLYPLVCSKMPKWTSTTRVNPAADPAADSSAAPQEPPKRGRQSRGLLCVDLVEDRNRNRLVAVFMTFALYIVVGGELIRFGRANTSDTVGRVIVSSQFPGSATLGPSLAERIPGVAVISSSGTPFSKRVCPYLRNASACDASSGASEDVHVEAQIVRITYEVEPRRTLDCSTERALQLAGTLEALRVADACSPVLVGGDSVTDDQGVAKFPALAIVSGPPASYTLELSPGDNVLVTAEMQLTSDVVSIEVLNTGAGVKATIGVPLAPQPRVRVSDATGKPLANRTVVVWASSVANIYRADAGNSSRGGFFGQDVSDDGKQTYYIRGQNLALLSGTRAVTDADGYAEWDALTVTAASTQIAWLNFYCDGRLGACP